MLPNKSAATGTSALFFFISSAQVALAPSTCFMLAMQAFFWLAARAFTKLGIAIAASKPMMATTIMISTSVKPARREFLSFILCTFLSGGVNERQKAGLLLVPHFVHELPSTDRRQVFSNGHAIGGLIGLRWPEMPEAIEFQLLWSNSGNE